MAPSVALLHGFSAFWGMGSLLVFSVPWSSVLWSALGPWPSGCYLLVLVAFLRVFTKPSYMGLEALSRDSACKTEKTTFALGVQPYNALDSGAKRCG